MSVPWNTDPREHVERAAALLAVAKGGPPPPAAPCADGSVTSYLYQGNCTTITDPAGKWKAYTSDALGNLTLVTEPAPGGGNHQTTYTYNLLNKLTGVNMPRGSVTQTRTFNYSLTTGRLMSATNPENGTVSYTYRADGSLASKTDAKSQQTTYTYDGYGRLTQAAGYSYYYDSNPLDASYPPNYGWGRLAAVAWTSSSMGMNFTEMYRYSVGGLMIGKRVQLSPNPDPNLPGGKGTETSNLDATFTYDAEGHYLGPQGYPDWPQSFAYSRDTLGRPSGITANPLNPGDDPRLVVKDVIYGVAGEMQQARVYKEPPVNAYGTSYLKRTWSYNTLFQATRETAVDEESYGPTATTVLDLQYTYTAGQNNGRITQRTEAVSGEQVSYSYDSLNRLIQAVTTGGARHRSGAQARRASQ
jgi:YD repeat-containing protein